MKIKMWQLFLEYTFIYVGYNKEIYLQWITRHSSIRGNGRVDELARLTVHMVPKPKGVVL